MTSITIRQLDSAIKAALKVRAAQHGRSMEAEVRSILQAAVETDAPDGQTLFDLAEDLFPASVRVKGGLDCSGADETVTESPEFS